MVAVFIYTPFNFRTWFLPFLGLTFLVIPAPFGEKKNANVFTLHDLTVRGIITSWLEIFTDDWFAEYLAVSHAVYVSFTGSQRAPAEWLR